MTVGESIKKYRKQCGLTQKKLAKLTRLNEVTIRSYEAGKYKPKIEQLKKLADALGVRVYDLIGYDDITLTCPPNLADVKSVANALDVLGKDEQDGIMIDLTGVPVDNIGDYLTTIFPHLEEQSRKEKEDMHRAEVLIELEKAERKRFEVLAENYFKLNENGQNKAVERVEELTEIPKYRQPPESDSDP